MPIILTCAPIKRPALSLSLLCIPSVRSPRPVLPMARSCRPRPIRWTGPAPATPQAHPSSQLSRPSLSLPLLFAVVAVVDLLPARIAASALSLSLLSAACPERHHPPSLRPKWYEILQVNEVCDCVSSRSRRHLKHKTWHAFVVCDGLNQSVNGIAHILPKKWPPMSLRGRKWRRMKLRLQIWQSAKVHLSDTVGAEATQN